MTRAIVCGIDGSPDSQAALGDAADLAERRAARLVLAYVVDPIPSPYAAVGPAASAMPPLSATAAERETEGERLLDDLAEATGVDHAAAMS